MLQHKMYLATLKGSHQIGSKNMMRQYRSYFRKCKLFNIHLQETSERSKAAFTTIKAKVQREIRTIKDNWWEKKAEKLQEMADKNDTHGLTLS